MRSPLFVYFKGMLSSWTLSDFKPFHDRLELPLQRLTVFAGLNSSGKSSILQSILLVSQTLASPNPDKALILNGNLVQLGVFDAVRNDRASGAIVIGFSVVQDEPTPRRPFGPGRRFRQTAIQETIVEVECEARFVSPTIAASPDTAAINAVRVMLEEASIRVFAAPEAGQHATRTSGRVGLDDETEPTEIRLRTAFAPLATGQQIEWMKGVSDSHLRLIPYPEGQNYGARFNDEDVAASPFLVRLNHFLPARFLGKFELRERQEQALARTVDYLFAIEAGTGPYVHPGPGGPAAVEALASTEATPNLVTTFKEMVGKKKDVEAFTGGTISGVARWCQAVPLRTKAKYNFTRDVKAAVVAWLLARQNADDAHGPRFGLEYVDDYELALIEAGAQAVVNAFSTKIRYLGPLRADPSAAQKFAPSNEPDDVGPKGEFAAAVYDVNRRQPVQWLDPTTGKVCDAPLEEAVDIWARHLGVAHGVSTREAGLSGVSWMVKHLPDSRERPLPAVGVGVSQVLPILVAGLLAPGGAIILIEQPELHLHPRAQARLGDFLLGLTQIGKQCIVETHSDCLVNQLRYWMVKEPERYRKSTQVYFAEQNSEGNTSFQTIEVSEGGNIVNWPQGFFDEALGQEDRITREATIARALRTKSDV